MAEKLVTGSTPLTGSTYVDTWGNGSTYITSTQHYYVGYSNSAGKHRFSTCFQLTVPNFEGTATGVTFTLTFAKAVDNLSSRTYKVGVSRNATNSVYQSGYYDKYGSLTNTVTATISSTSTTVTTNFSTTSLTPGDVLYVYVYSGAAEYNTCKCTAISGNVTWMYTETTDETGYEGVSRVGVANCTTSGGQPSTTKFGTGSTTISLTPTPVVSGSSFYIRLYQLQYAANTYTFYIYKKASNWSFTNGQTSSPTGGTLITSFTPTETGSECFKSMSLPSSYFKIGSSTSFCILAKHESDDKTKYWGVGTAFTSDGSPQTVKINLDGDDWFYYKFYDTLTSVDATTATFSLNFKSDNSPRYLNYVYARTAATSYSGSSSMSGSAYTHTTTQMSTTSGSQTKTMTISGLTPGTEYDVYFVGSTSSTYASSTYYGLESISFTTDDEVANYSGTITATVTSSSTATINVDNLTSDINLTGYYFAVKTDAGESVSSLSSYVRGDNDGINLTGLAANTSHTYHIYAQSSESGIFYKINSITFTTDASSYSGTITASSIGITSANLSLSGLTPTTNLDGKWYISETNNSNAVSSLSVLGSGGQSSSISVSNLAESSQTKLYGYVYSSASKLYYPIGSVTFITSASSYSAGVTATGITPTSAVLCMFDITPTTNLSTTYYISSTNYGDDVSSIGTPVASVAFSYSHTATGLVPGHPYTYYIYVYNTASSTYRLVADITFTTYSSIIYRGVNGENKPHRVYKLNDNTGELEGCVFYKNGKMI